MATCRIAGVAALAVAALALAAAGGAGARHASFPTRIVSLSPTATEDLFAIGAGKQVVAVDNQSNYPPSAPMTKLSGYTPNAEAIAGYNPDLVVITEDANGIKEALQKLKIPVVYDPPAVGLAGAYSQIAQLGKLTGHASGAAAVVSKMKREIAQQVASIPKGHSLSFYEELSPDYYSSTSTTFAGQLLKMLGLKDIADAAKGSSSGYPKLSGEYIVGADPDLIVLADTKCCGQTAAKVKARPGWSTIKAVSSGAIVPVSDDIASRWGPRVVDFVKAVAAKVRTIDAQSG
ncbi:MAG TPA: ABC transporter substrate-binding protein [Gaiellaceae bacterium]|nr:ABC transporter substrate-binding protein [Gaiellaceae bacterium]